MQDVQVKDMQVEATDSDFTVAARAPAGAGRPHLVRLLGVRCARAYQGQRHLGQGSGPVPAGPRPGAQYRREQAS